MHFGMFAFMESICCHGKLKDGNTELERTTQMQRKCTRLPDCICVLGLRCLFPQHHLQVPMLPSPLVYFFFTPQNHIRQHPVPTALSLPACRTERWDGLPEHLHLTLRTAVRHYMHLHMHRAALNNSACWRASCFGYFCVDFFFFLKFLPHRTRQTSGAAAARLEPALCWVHPFHKAKNPQHAQFNRTHSVLHL